MEFIYLILILVGLSFAGTIISAVFRTMGAAAKSAVGKGSFSGNMDLAFKEMQPLEIRFKDGHLGDDDESLVTKEIEGRGLFPLSKVTRIGFVTSVFDATDKEWEPVLSAIEGFQEPTNIVYQNLTEVGQVSLNQGLVSWVRLGIVLPDILQPPYSGDRQMVALLRMIDLDNEPSINLGRHQENDAGLLWTGVLKFGYNFLDKGYAEAAEHRDEARAIALKIGIAVAMADGSLDTSEGECLKEWIIRTIETFSGDKRAELKRLYNEAMREAYADAKQGNLSLSALTARLNEIGEKKLKYDAIELCFDVMAADGVADASEMKTIRQVADALSLDLDEIEKLRDQKIVGLNSSISDQASVEDLLGIEPTWNAELIKEHLRTEFQKWNNRINTLSEGEERDNAQRMLDVIAEARMKYG